MHAYSVYSKNTLLLIQGIILCLYSLFSKTTDTCAIDKASFKNLTYF